MTCPKAEKFYRSLKGGKIANPYEIIYSIENCSKILPPAILNKRSSLTWPNAGAFPVAGGPEFIPPHKIPTSCSRRNGI
jgi:hypothetical protein